MLFLIKAEGTWLISSGPRLAGKLFVVPPAVVMRTLATDVFEVRNSMS